MNDWQAKAISLRTIRAQDEDILNMANTLSKMIDRVNHQAQDIGDTLGQDQVDDEILTTFFTRQHLLEELLIKFQQTRLNLAKCTSHMNNLTWDTEECKAKRTYSRKSFEELYWSLRKTGMGELPSTALKACTRQVLQDNLEEATTAMKYL